MTISKKIIHILGIIDAGHNIGLGHLKRTNNLLNGLVLENNKKKINCVLEKDFDSTGDILKKISDINKHRKIDIIVIDSYKLPEGIINKIIDSYPETVHLMLDDFNRLKDYNCDFILNYNPISLKLDYYTAYHTQRLFGLEYFPLSNEIRELRKRSIARKEIKEVLVTMGGSDAANFTEVICATFLKGFENYTFHIVIGPDFRNKDEIIERYKKEKHYRLYQELGDLSLLMAKSDIAISSSGVTAYELACLGKPAVLVPIARDQILNARFFMNEFSFPSLDFNDTNSKNKIIKTLGEAFFKLTRDSELRQEIVNKLKKCFKPDNNRLSEMLMKRLTHKILRRRNPIKISSFAAISEEYDISLRRKKAYEKVRWGNRKGMMNRFRLANRLLSTIKYESLLDIGCGTGELFKVIDTRNKKCFAYDLNFKMLLYAQKNSDNNIRYFNASSNPIPIKSNSIDVLTLIGVLQNCGLRLNEFIKEINRVIKPKGYLFLITKNLGWSKFVNGDLTPEKEHNWFFDYEIGGELIKNAFDIIAKSGFLNINGKLVDIEESHEIFYWARKK